MKLKLNVPLMGRKAGDIIAVEDSNGVPRDKYWRNRLADSAIDGCVEIVDNRKKSTKEPK